MISKKDLNALKERVNNIDPILTGAIVVFIGTPTNLEIVSFGEDDIVNWVFWAIYSAVYL